MEQELYYEWCLFEKRSLELTNNLNIKEIDKSRVLKIMKIPSLYWDCVRRWELYEDLVVRIDWFCQDDYKMFSSIIEREKYQNYITPTIKYKIHKVEKSYSELIVKELSNISIPLNTKIDLVGCDGTDYELELGRYWANIKIKWWEDGTEQWKAVDNFTKRLMGEFDDLLIDEEYADALSFDVKLWLEPSSNIKITKDLFNFLKQFWGFSDINVIKISEIFKSEKPVLLESKFDYMRYRNLMREFDKYGLKVEFEYIR